MPWVNRRPRPILEPYEARHAPKPHGLLSGRRTGWRRAVARAIALIDRGIDRLPFGHWLHRLRMRGLAFPTVEVVLRRGGFGLDGMRIAFLSDIHAGLMMDAERLGAIFAQVATMKPDLVCLGGDLINTREREILLFRKALSLLRPPLGVFAVPGNHDHFYGSDIGLWQAFLHEQGVQTLINRGTRIQRSGGSLWLCGVDDLTEGTPDLRAALDGRREDEPAILLSHHPDFFFEAAAADVDMTLSGHTHGGQVLLFGWTPLNHTLFGWWQGMHKEADCRLYVSRGVGTTVLPLRVGAPPEIPVLRLSRGIE